MQERTFRKDINGLRGIAVLSVLLYHILININSNYDALSIILNKYLIVGGGFLGVDIFFVISGFLMTSIIIRGIDSNNFSIIKFWKNRATRICPALFFVILITVIISFFLLSPYSYHELGKEGMAALGFVSNFRFAKDEGYFTTNALDKVFLHTWSLSVEWQFYIIYPIILYLLAKFLKTEKLKLIILCSGILLFIFSIIISKNPGSYFMLHIRAWELIGGGIVYCYPIKIKQSSKHILSIFGLIVILCSIIFVKTPEVWSPYEAAPAIFGAMLILWADNQKSLLSNRLLQYVGKISYSIYLIHWPILVFLSKFDLLEYLIISLFFILIYSAISFHFIEQKRKWSIYFIILYAGLVGYNQFLVDSKGIPERNNYTKTENSVSSKILYGGVGFKSSGDIESGHKIGTPWLLIAGDSHARQYANLLDQKMPFINIFMDANFNYSLVYYLRDKNKNISDSNHYFNNLDKAASLPTITDIIIAHNWNLYYHDFDKQTAYYQSNIQSQNEFFDKVAKGILYFADKHQNSRIYLIGQTYTSSKTAISDCIYAQESSNFVTKLLFASHKCKTFIKINLKDVSFVDKKLQQIASKRSNLFFIDPKNVLCKEDMCKLTVNGNPIFSDDNHLSTYGADFVGNYLLENILNNK